MTPSNESVRSRAVRAPKMAELVADELRAQIIRGELEEGQALPPESELMEEFGVSRPTLREALRVLEAESLIRVRRGARGGARVTRPNAQVAARYAALLLQSRKTRLDDVYRARALVEPPAARALASSGTKRTVSRLRDAYDDESAALDDPQLHAAVAARFHQRVMELAGNATLAILSEMLVEITESRVAMIFDSQSIDVPALTVRQHGHEDHRKLLELIESGDAAAAETHWRTHLEGMAKIILTSAGPDVFLDLPD